MSLTKKGWDSPSHCTPFAVGRGLSECREIPKALCLHRRDVLASRSAVLLSPARAWQA